MSLITDGIDIEGREERKKRVKELFLPRGYPKVGVAGKTGSRRTMRPIVDYNKCIGCGQCIIACPEDVIDFEIKRKELPNGRKLKQRIPKIDYDYCKGCLVCMHSCPVKAISYELEVK